jgi:hypothetical protein
MWKEKKQHIANTQTTQMKRSNPYADQLPFAKIILTTFCPTCSYVDDLTKINLPQLLQLSQQDAFQRGLHLKITVSKPLPEGANQFQSYLKLSMLCSTNLWSLSPKILPNKMNAFRLKQTKSIKVKMVNQVVLPTMLSQPQRQKELGSLTVLKGKRYVLTFFARKSRGGSRSEPV